MVFAWFVVVKVDGERERYASGAVQSLGEIGEGAVKSLTRLATGDGE